MATPQSQGLKCGTENPVRAPVVTTHGARGPAGTGNAGRNALYGVRLPDRGAVRPTLTQSNAERKQHWETTRGKHDEFGTTFRPCLSVIGTPLSGTRAANPSPRALPQRTEAPACLPNREAMGRVHTKSPGSESDERTPE